jgi:hypothetical protein
MMVFVSALSGKGIETNKRERPYSARGIIGSASFRRKAGPSPA